MLISLWRLLKRKPLWAELLVVDCQKLNLRPFSFQPPHRRTIQNKRSAIHNRTSNTLNSSRQKQQQRSNSKHQTINSKQKFTSHSRMAHAKELVTAPRKYPFAHMRLADHSVLDAIEGRYTCTRCSRSRKFFCYNCHIPVGPTGDLIPHVPIPVHIDIIKHRKEIDGKSTAVHAAILSSERVRIFTHPDIPDYSAMPAGSVVLIFPSAKSQTVAQLFGRKIQLKPTELPRGTNPNTLLVQRVEEIVDKDDNDDDTNETRRTARVYNYENLPVKRAVFIDSTWNQSRGIYKDPRVRALPTVVLQHRFSQFWRHQRGSPRWYLATIEAVHQFLLEMHVNAWGLNANYRGLDNLEIGRGFFEMARVVEHADGDCVDKEAPYNGQYDNLMFFFANMYDLIHKYYDHHELKSYRRRPI